MTPRRAVYASVLGLLLAGCGGTDEGDDETQGMAGASSGGTMGAGYGGTGAQGGRADVCDGAACTAGQATGGTGGSMMGGGASAGNASGGRGGDAAGGMTSGGAGSGGIGASAGLAGMGTGGVDGGFGGMAAGASGDGGRMGGRGGMGGRMATGGEGGRGGAAGMSSSGAGGMANGDCPGNGHVSYTLTKKASPSADEQDAYDLITEAMDKAVEYYNCYTDITQATMVTYVPSVETADGNSNGSIRFGGKSYMEYITAMHEIAHTVGVGTVSQWSQHVVNGIWNGEQATAKLRELTGIADDEVHGDSQHFWPYGLNYTSEVKSETDVINHCYIVVALRADMGLN